MTKSQRITLMADWWPKACQTQGWNESDRELRLHVLSEAVKRPLQSANDLNSTSDIDAVKSHLRMLTDDLPAAIETDDPTIGEARRIRNVITTQILPCLALYEPSTRDYLQTVISGLVRWYKTDRPIRPPTLDDLDARPIIGTRNGRPQESPSQLHQALMTLSARLDAKRRAAKHTLHDMKILAKVPCHCRICMQPRPARVLVCHKDEMEPF